MNITPEQVKEARRLLKWSQIALSVQSGLGVAVLAKFEASAQLSDSRLGRLRAALEAAGVEFFEENCGTAGVRLRKSATASTPSMLNV